MLSDSLARCNSVDYRRDTTLFPIPVIAPLQHRPRCLLSSKQRQLDACASSSTPSAAPLPPSFSPNNNCDRIDFFHRRPCPGIPSPHEATVDSSASNRTTSWTLQLDRCVQPSPLSMLFEAILADSAADACIEANGACDRESRMWPYSPSNTDTDTPSSAFGMSSGVNQVLGVRESEECGAGATWPSSPGGTDSLVLPNGFRLSVGAGQLPRQDRFDRQSATDTSIPRRISGGGDAGHHDALHFDRACASGISTTCALLPSSNTSSPSRPRSSSPLFYSRTSSTTSTIGSPFTAHLPLTPPALPAAGGDAATMLDETLAELVADHALGSPASRVRAQAAKSLLFSSLPLSPRIFAMRGDGQAHERGSVDMDRLESPCVMDACNCSSAPGMHSGAVGSGGRTSSIDRHHPLAPALSLWVVERKASVPARAPTRPARPHHCRTTLEDFSPLAPLAPLPAQLQSEQFVEASPSLRSLRKAPREYLQVEPRLSGVFELDRRVRKPPQQADTFLLQPAPRALSRKLSGRSEQRDGNVVEMDSVAAVRTGEDAGGVTAPVPAVEQVASLDPDRRSSAISVQTFVSALSELDSPVVDTHRNVAPNCRFTGSHTSTDKPRKWGDDRCSHNRVQLHDEPMLVLRSPLALSRPSRAHHPLPPLDAPPTPTATIPGRGARNPSLLRKLSSRLRRSPGKPSNPILDPNAGAAHVGGTDYSKIGDDVVVAAGCATAVENTWSAVTPPGAARTPLMRNGTIAPGVVVVGSVPSRAAVVAGKAAGGRADTSRLRSFSAAAAAGRMPATPVVSASTGGRRRNLSTASVAAAAAPTTARILASTHAMPVVQTPTAPAPPPPLKPSLKRQPSISSRHSSSHVSSSSCSPSVKLTRTPSSRKTIVGSATACVVPSKKVVTFGAVEQIIQGVQMDG